MPLKNSVKIIGLILIVLLIDQSLKIWVKTHIPYGDAIHLLGWERAQLHFVENNGMAFGISLGKEYGKLALSLFRVIAVGFLIYYIRLLLKSKANLGLLISFALILAGAIGNIIDSAFYGLIFSASYHGNVAQMFPEEGGYAPFLYGKVVDMLYFPLLKGNFPDWFPQWGGQQYIFFRPVFNIADMSITFGVLNILLFQRSFFNGPEEGATVVEEKSTAEVLEANTEQEVEESETSISEKKDNSLSQNTDAEE